ARCLRDEDLRADRQFEFMQLDAEMAFADQDDVLAAITRAVLAAAEAATGVRVGDVPSMTWDEAQERFGTDKPDVRFGIELVEVTDVFAATEFNAFKGKVVKGICVPGQGELGRAALDRLTDRAKQLGASGLVWLKVDDEAPLTGPVAKFVGETEQKALVVALGAGAGDLLLLVADGDRMLVNRVLGGLRLDRGRPPPHAGFAFGIDRLAALLAGEENIREIIAFPKTQSGADPLTNAPTPVDEAQLRELGLRVLPRPS